MSDQPFTPGHCPIDGQLMRPWLKVPIDVRRCVPIPNYSDVYRCACGYGAILPLPPADVIPEFYKFDQYYTHASAKPPAAEEPSFLDKLRMHIAWLADRDRLSVPSWLHREFKGVVTVCDIGCGSGEKMRALREMGYTVTGIEPDAQTSARTLSDGMEILDGTAEYLPEGFSQRRFDAVVMMHVLEHCREPLHALENVKGLLKNGGTFVCEVPNNEALSRVFAGITWCHLGVPRHLHFFTGDTLRAHLQRAGFRIRKVEYVRYCRQFSNGTIANERRVRDVLGFGPRNSRVRTWALLALTAFSPDRFKYDSVRIVASA